MASNKIKAIPFSIHPRHKRWYKGLAAATPLF